MPRGIGAFGNPLTVASRLLLLPEQSARGPLAGRTADGPPGSLAELAYQRIRQAIQSGVFQPGARLRERDVAKLNRKLHQAIFLGAHNHYLPHSLASLTDVMTLLLGTTFSLPWRPDTAHAEHVAMIEAIEGRDMAGAETAARAHIRVAHKTRLALLRRDRKSAGT